MPAKLLAIIDGNDVGSNGTDIFLAAADGQTYRLDLESNEKVTLGQGSTAPMTCLVGFAGDNLFQGQVQKGAVYAGGWNKQITSFPLSPVVSNSTTNPKQITFKAHQDFVKCLCLARYPDQTFVILSGGADGDLNIWTLDGKRLASLRPQSRGIECITLDPFSSSDAPRVFFSTSQREIYNFIVPNTAEMTRTIQLSDPIVQHETSVYRMRFDNDGDMWTASADKTAKRLVREDGFLADTTLAHPDFVRDIVLHEAAALAITACRDEEIRLWNTGTSQLVHIFTGHYEEVTGLALKGNMLLSISIDATLRRWDLAPQGLAKAIELSKSPDLLEDEPEPKNDLGMLTEEEEAELRALMEEEEVETLEKMARDEQ